jgi:DNA-binding GntR family transcriptional regulator
MGARILRRIEPISKKDRIVTMMREAIVSGQIESGAPIVETKVAQELGVGQPIVREALIELAHQGFVRREAYRATYVTKLARVEIEQAFQIRRELEALAIEWAAPRAVPTDLEALRALADGMAQGAERMDLDQFYENDIALHRRIWELSGNKYLVDALERIVVPLFAFFLMKVRCIQESYVQSAAMHRRIVDAIGVLEPAMLRQLQITTLAGFRDQCMSMLLPDDSGDQDPKLHPD